MTAEARSGSRALAAELRAILLELAHHQDECAANEAAAQPYWAACPPSVHGHRAAAEALRDQADQLLAWLRSAAA
ncbi:hypothetical protein JCM18899A_53340 [Nocardioides sp. AN3]